MTLTTWCGAELVGSPRPHSMGLKMLGGGPLQFYGPWIPARPAKPWLAPIIVGRGA